MFYYSTPGGGVASRSADPTVIPLLPGWTEIDQTTYEAAVTAFETSDQAAQEDKLADAEAARHAAYLDLKASAHTVDWDDATVRLITGYYGA